MKKRGRFPAVLVAMMLFPVVTLQLRAQSYAYSPVHVFSTGSLTTPHTNGDGISPRAGLVMYNNVLYGMANSGGGAGFGAIFRVNPDGSGFTNLYSFTNGVDGGNPTVSSSLAVGVDQLFGVTGFGGTNVPHKGAVFRINPDGQDFQVIYSFNGTDGQNPAAGLISDRGVLYGTTINGGGTSKHGAVFKMNLDGSQFTQLYAFSTTDGSRPSATLLLTNNTLFGTTFNGSTGDGTIFRIDTDGNNFTNLYTLGGTNGSLPYAGVVLYSNWLFGTTSSGASSNYGTIYRVNTDGSGFTNLHNFTGGIDSGGPYGGLALLGNTLYGVALAGATNVGTVYRINPDGSGFTNIYNFTGGSDGGGPEGTLLLSGNTLFGTAALGGIGTNANGNGTVFALTLPVSLGISRSNASCVVSWPSPSTGMILQTNGSVAGGNWSTLNAPVTDDGTNRRVIISPPAGNLYFRLMHP